MVAQIQFYLKEFHKCVETFEKVIELEPVRNQRDDSTVQWTGLIVSLVRH